MVTFIFIIDMSTKYIRYKAKRTVNGIIAKGKDIEALRNDEYALKSALRKAGIAYKSKKWKIYDVIIEKYLSESYVD